jgi:uncharacterized membrane protein YjfL (UPF0719 family)
MAQWDFDGDEAFFFFVAAIVTIVAAFRWYLPLARVTRFGQRPGVRPLLAITPVVAMLALLVVLVCWSDPKSVQGHPDYILLFLAGGGAWLFVASVASSVLGVSPRDDAIERGNLAAAIACAGALGGATAIYAFANVGAGPTIWTTIAPAIVATAVWLALWFVVELLGRPGEAIALDRDVASALRHAAYLLASGIVLGRAVAGNWTSWQGTWHDFVRQARPVAALAVFAIVAHLVLRPTPTRACRSLPKAGLVPGLVLLVLAIGYVASLGKPDIGVHVITYEQYTGQPE